LKYLFSIFLFFIFLRLDAQEIIKSEAKLMGCHFDFTVIADNETEGKSFIKIAVNEIKRIEKLISSWDENSQTSKINRNAGLSPVTVDKELFDLINRSLAISNITDGAFDISYASLDKVWKFDGSMKVKPSNEEILNSIEQIGFQKILLNHNDTSVFLTKKGMKIGFGGIGKGYAADKAKALLISKGVKAGIINASGDMNTWGTMPNGEEWKIAITNPMNKNNVFATLPLKKGAVVTSGDYEKFVTFDGVRYAHIINPKTGYPSTGIISASVFAPSAEMADALATSIFVMGVENGIFLINQLKEVECIIIDTDGKVFKSNGIEIDNHNKL
jgi:thiamine biosynthesis lipoprotein